MARTLGSHAKHTKPKISAIALNLFSEQGFAAVSMRQIAAKAGLQAGALYNYFPDKEKKTYKKNAPGPWPRALKIIRTLSLCFLHAIVMY